MQERVKCTAAGGNYLKSAWKEGMLKDTYPFYDFTYGGQGTYNL